MHPWLTSASLRLAATSDSDPATLELDQPTIDALLDLARVAAHESGERTNAPLLTYLVGLAHGRHGGSLETLLSTAAGDGEA